MIISIKFIAHKIFHLTPHLAEVTSLVRVTLKHSIGRLRVR